MDTYRLIRDIKVEDGYDVVVAGGGPAGTAAAICAGRLGARVLLIEATGCLGGMGTSGLVTAFDPMADGEKMLVGGLMREIVETLYKRGFLYPGINPDTWRKNYHQWTPFSAEGLKLLLDELVTEAGVEVRFFTRVVDAEADKDTCSVSGLVIQNIEGYSYIKSKTFIDATGDGVLADFCGVEYREAGRDTEKPMPATLCSLFANINWQKIIDKGHELVGYDKPGFQHEALLRAVDEGHFSQPDRHLPGMARTGETLGCLNAGHVFNLNSLKCRDLTDGMMQGRRLVREYADFYRKYVPGHENIELVTTASLMGIRESRRIVGEYELNINDYLSRRQFPDQIGVFNKFIDIHPYECSKEEFERFNSEAYKLGRLGVGEFFGIPYGIIVPKGWKNLWVAGRCNSSDVKVHGSIRVMPAAAMMGQAAGTAAVQTINTGEHACSLNTEQLVKTLRDNGAYLPQTELCKNMTCC